MVLCISPACSGVSTPNAQGSATAVVGRTGLAGYSEGTQMLLSGYSEANQRVLKIPVLSQRIRASLTCTEIVGENDIKSTSTNTE